MKNNMYTKIKEKQPEMKNCFFAFSKEQMNEGIENLAKFYDNQGKEIAEKCDPQAVYDYEYDNHECGYTGDDIEAVEIVEGYFGKDVKVKRK